MMRFRSLPTVTAWIAAGLVAAGFLGIIISWRGAGRTASIALQMPFVISGAFAGLGLVVFGVAIGHVELTRRLAAEEERTTRDLIDTAARTVVALRDQPAVPPPTPARRRRRTREAAS